MDADKPIASELSEKEVILLGLLAEAPSHAYILEEKIRKRRMQEWTEIGFSSIYRVLARLEEQGLIDTQFEHEGQGATRKVHSINEAGRRVLAEGVLTHIATVRPAKSPVQVGLAFVDEAPRTSVLDTLRKRLQAIEELRNHVASIAQKLEEGATASQLCGERMSDNLANRTGPRLLFDHLRRHLNAEHGFLQDAIVSLENESESRKAEASGQPDHEASGAHDAIEKEVS